MNANLLWAAWLVGTVGSFLALELPRLGGVPGDTLSERLRAWLGVAPHRKWGVAGAWVFLGFLGWFAFHIVTNKV